MRRIVCSLGGEAKLKNPLSTCPLVSPSYQPTGSFRSWLLPHLPMDHLVSVDSSLIHWLNPILAYPMGHLMSNDTWLASTPAHWVNPSLLIFPMGHLTSDDTWLISSLSTGSILSSLQSCLVIRCLLTHGSAPHLIIGSFDAWLQFAHLLTWTLGPSPPPYLPIW